MGKPDEKQEWYDSISRQRILEAQLSWISSLVLFFCTVYVVVKVDILWAIFGVTALSLYVLPIITTRDLFKALPWEMTILLSAPVMLHISSGSQMMSEQFAWWDDLTSLAFAFSLSTIGFLLTIELNLYTGVRMNRAFSVFFVFMFTLSSSGFWMMGEYISDKLFGTAHLLSNEAVMRDFVWILIGGILMGFVYAAYIRTMSEKRLEVFGLIHLWEVQPRTEA